MKITDKEIIKEIPNLYNLECHFDSLFTKEGELIWPMLSNIQSVQIKTGLLELTKKLKKEILYLKGFDGE